MTPFTKLGDLQQLQQEEWARDPEKFDSEITRIMTIYPNKSRLEIETIVRGLAGNAVVYQNDQYSVIVQPLSPEMVHLSVERLDSEPIRDWYVMQEIKNVFVGPECEGCELYPAMSRLVDTSNQYHIWAWTDGVRIPFGYGDRLVIKDDKGET